MILEFCDVDERRQLAVADRKSLWQLSRILGIDRGSLLHISLHGGWTALRVVPLLFQGSFYTMAPV